jgi:hypothetical protein
MQTTGSLRTEEARVLSAPFAFRLPRHPASQRHRNQAGAQKHSYEERGFPQRAPIAKLVKMVKKLK